MVALGNYDTSQAHRAQARKSMVTNCTFYCCDLPLLLDVPLDGICLAAPQADRDKIDHKTVQGSSGFGTSSLGPLLIMGATMHVPEMCAWVCVSVRPVEGPETATRRLLVRLAAEACREPRGNPY